MDFRFLKVPIPWEDIINFDTIIQTIYNKDIDVLLLQLKAGAKQNVRFSLAYKYNNWIKATDDNLIAISLDGMEEQSSYDFGQAFSGWIMRGRRRTLNSSLKGQSAGFGQRRG